MLEFVFFVLAGAFRAALSSFRALWALGVQSSGQATCSGGLFGLLCGSLGQQKGRLDRAAHRGSFPPCRRTAGQSSVPLGFLVVPHVVMGTRTDSVSFGVMPWVQFWAVNGTAAAPWFHPVAWDGGGALRSSGHDSLPALNAAEGFVRGRMLTDLLALPGLHLRAAVVSERVARVPFWCVWVVAPN